MSGSREAAVFCSATLQNKNPALPQELTGYLRHRALLRADERRDIHRNAVRLLKAPPEHELRDESSREGIACPYGVSDLNRRRWQDRLITVEPHCALSRSLGANEAEDAPFPEELIESVRITAPKSFHAAEDRQLSSLHLKTSVRRSESSITSLL